MSNIVDNIIYEISLLPDHHVYGRVTSILGMLVEINGVEGRLSIGDHCSIEARSGRKVLCEVVGFSETSAQVMPFGTLEGIGLGCKVEIGTCEPVIYPGSGWLGRVIDAFGRPLDDKGSLPIGPAT